MMTYEHILHAVDGPVATITLNRPERMNAYSRPMILEVRDAFLAADADDDIRAIILTAAGERAFCAGADMSAGGDNFKNPTKSDPSLQNAERLYLDAVYNCRKPSIAAINGAAVGIGATIILPLDIRICSENARFGFVFARRGVSPEVASAWFLPQLVGVSRALQWCLTGRLFGAAEALASGLVSDVTAQDDLLPSARCLAMEIADWTSPVSVAVTRQMMWRFGGLPSYEDMNDLDSQIFTELSAGVDVSEGVNAFLEKRPPRFPGKVSRDMPPSYPWWKT
ncbi:MAG: enoyl-CoA hydratase-related protein [Sphingobium sp.]